MTLTTTLQKQIETVLSMALEDESFEDFLERFNLDPTEVFLHLFEAGLIDPELFESYLIED